MHKNQNRNSGYSLSDAEQLQLASAFEANGIQVPVQKYRIRYAQKVHGNYRRDPDGVDFKWFSDSLVNNGILKDDSFKEVVALEIFPPEVVPTTEEEMIIIEIEVVEA